MKKTPQNRTDRRLRVSLLLLSSITLLLIIVLGLLPRKDPKRETAQQSEEFTYSNENSEESTSPDSESKDKPITGKLAFVIDDAGYSLELAYPFLDFPEKLTIAVLPRLPQSEAITRMALQAGKEVILHCPMEPLEDRNPGPGVILTSHERNQILQILTENFLSVPAAAGLSNHMGSKATQDALVMDVVMEYLGSKRMFFLDSKTTALSIAQRAAANAGVPFVERDIFIDNRDDFSEIKQWVQKGMDTAKKKGYAILIGHVNSTMTPAVLENMRSIVIENGYAFVGLSDILDSLKEANHAGIGD